MFNKVFISYATEDFPYAEKLYNFLLLNGYKPWMDKKDLNPGQNWDFFIQQELGRANFIILLLSSASVNKRGYVQREFSTALNYCEEKLDSDIYIIPLKIDSCEVPVKLSKFHWVEYGTSDCFKKIADSLNLQKEKYLKEKQHKKFKAEGIEIIEKNIEEGYGENSPKLVFEAKYQIFLDPKSDSLKEVNIKIENEVINNLISSRDEYFQLLKDFHLEDMPFKSDSTRYGYINIKFLNSNFISLLSHWSEYHTGAAHGVYGSNGRNYLTNPLRNFNLQLLFQNQSSLKILRDCVDEKLIGRVSNKIDLKERTDFYFTEEGISADWNNFKNFYFTENSIIFIYNIYEIACFALGEHHAEITFEELKQLFPNEKKLIEFINSIE
jgi:hypothetical protein